MNAEDIMRRNAHPLKGDDTIESAVDLMEKERLRHIPIIENDDTLIGIISDRDVRDARYSIFSDKRLDDILQKPLTTIMKTEVFTVHPLDFVADVASMLSEKRINAAPVAVDDKLIGMITGRDLLDTLVQLMGADQPSSQIEVKVSNVSGQLADVAAVFKDHGINVTSMLIYPDKQMAYQILAFRIQTMDARKAIASLEDKGYEIAGPTMPDMGGPASS
ncbi:CBS and ACT domain-containing protein [Natribacillus halophilus]|uniref:Acetoin utilization protein AcuB n=1 Tax=Natribacillus halophilus TaxID=549003 RepID=A0A1G8NF31_9BACI|nr:CBS and ACT domain-containing protein [Natribacillus halophilus]SDI78773.1 acetoin utilization protein AcuB [Natribacillus halophilus]